jgi:hypothetical protein
MKGLRDVVRKFSVPLLSASVLLLLGSVGVTAHASGATETAFFFDGFNGTSISARWNTSIETSGVRWCWDSPSALVTGSGQWKDASLSSCNGVNAPPPYGQVTVGGGTAKFNATAEHAFPFVWRGGPSLPSPFPATGDFTLQIRMAYTNLGPGGSGLAVLSWPDSSPQGWNPPGFGEVFYIWADQSSGPFTSLAGQNSPAVSNPSGFHVYRLVYAAGQYTVYLDGNLWQGPVSSPVRPTAIWIGNPIVVPNPIAWTTLSVDSIAVVSTS